MTVPVKTARADRSLSSNLKAMKRLSIRILNSIAKQRGGRCLSKRNANFRIPLCWQCAVGHRWKAFATNVKNRGTWCPYCAGVKPSNVKRNEGFGRQSRRGVPFEKVCEPAYEADMAMR